MSNANQFLTSGFQDASRSDHNSPRVIMICPTFRPHDTTQDASFQARHSGLIALYQQFKEQDYPPEKLELRIADSSHTPHQFFEQLRDPRVKYIHINARTLDQKEALSRRHPEAAKFLLTDEELHQASMPDRIRALHAHCSRRFDPSSKQWIPSIPDPMNNPCPSIGMKRNVLCAMPFTADRSGVHPDIIIAADDDDWRAPNYVRCMVEALRAADWTKLVSYMLALYDSRTDSFTWGIKSLKFEHVVGDLPQLVLPKRAFLFRSGEGLSEQPAGEIFQSPRWHPLSTDGAVHALKHKAWRRTVDFCGGYMPVSYNEDVLMFEALRLLGHLHEVDCSMRDQNPVVSALLGRKSFSQAEIDSDRMEGPVAFNPVCSDVEIFIRLCCANISPVALTELLAQQPLPDKFASAFGYIQRKGATYDNLQGGAYAAHTYG